MKHRSFNIKQSLAGLAVTLAFVAGCRTVRDAIPTALTRSQPACAAGAVESSAAAEHGAAEHGNGSATRVRSVAWYRDSAVDVDYPIESTSPERFISARPQTIRSLNAANVRDVTLDQVRQTALSNNRIIRQNAQFLSPLNTLLREPETSPSVYDVALQESAVMPGAEGVEAALSAFDAQLATSMIWGRSEEAVNNPFYSGGLPIGSTLVEETGTFRSSLTKDFATGGTLQVGQDWDYNGNNVAFPTQLFQSAYRGSLYADYRHPLWGGSGTEFTRIAGPRSRNAGGLFGVGRGVVIARIRSDIAVADFEAAVANLLKDVEDLYWDLYLQYRLFDAAVVAEKSTRRVWDETRTLKGVGGVRGFEPADESRAHGQYLVARANSQSLLNQLLKTETRLRRLLVLPVNDGGILRPIDRPVTAEFSPDWPSSVVQALTQRPALRRQKWKIKRMELELHAARNLNRPRLDFVSRYQVNGFGDRLLGQSDNDGVTAQGFHSAAETLTQGNQTGWNLGLEMSFPLGGRIGHAQVRNLELRVARAREALAAQETEISHELATSIQELEAQFAITQTNRMQMQVADDNVRMVQGDFKAERATLKDVFEADAARSLAEAAYFSSLIAYNKAITEVFLRRGALLDYNSVVLAEGPWANAAYCDARDRAHARSIASDTDALHTEPPEFEQPVGDPVLHGVRVDDVLEPHDHVPIPRFSLPPEPEQTMDHDARNHDAMRRDTMDHEALEIDPVVLPLAGRDDGTAAAIDTACTPVAHSRFAAQPVSAGRWNVERADPASGNRWTWRADGADAMDMFGADAALWDRIDDR